MINWNDPISVNSEEFYLDAVFHTSLWTNFRTDLTKLFRESHAFASPHCAPYDVAKQYPKNQKIMCPENVLKNLKHRLIKYSTGTDVRARVASSFGRISLHFFFFSITSCCWFYSLCFHSTLAKWFRHPCLGSCRCWSGAYVQLWLIEELI